MSNDRTEHCFIRELCAGIDCIFRCPHYYEGNYYPHFRILSTSESYQCYHCLTGVKAPQWPGVKDTFQEMYRFLQPGFTSYSKTSREEINLNLRTYTLRSSMFPRMTFIFQLREDAQVGLLDCLQVWIQNLSSEKEIETAIRRLERLLSDLRHRREDLKATTKVSSPKGRESGARTPAPQTSFPLGDHAGARIVDNGHRPQENIGGIIEATIDGAADLEPLIARLQTLANTIGEIYDLRTTQETG
ncbi:hypothetical protein F4774DRAFT_75549 [Daldinia eschscholtzii]|nr:hypothetical protein F4774DRAFT_75549 [Daldinia eschscholtzii]